VPIGEGGLWEIHDYSPVSVTYADGRPVIQAIAVEANGRIPYDNKHTRGNYRPASGRLYWGGGDTWTGATALPEDGGPSSANAAIWSMDPANPTDITMETHRYDLDPARVFPAGIDQSAIVWDTDRDRGYVAPVNAFNWWMVVYNNPASWKADSAAGYAIPKFVNSKQFALVGDWTRVLTTNRQFKLFVDHPAWPNFVFGLDSSANTPCFQQCRVLAASYVATTNQTTVTFLSRPDVPAPSFARDGKGLRIADHLATGAPWPAERDSGAWLDNGYFGYDEATGKLQASVLELDPISRLYTRLNFALTSRYAVDANGGLALINDWSVSNYTKINLGGLGGTAVYCPASITGRNPEIISPSNHGPDGGYFGAWIFDLVTRRVDFFVTTNGIGNANTLGAGGTNAGLDPKRKRIYAHSATDGGLYCFDVVKRRLARVIERIAYQGKVVPLGNGDAGSTVYNAELDMIEVYYETDAGSGTPTLYLINPDTLEVHRVGNRANGQPISGNQWFRAGSRTVGEGGQEPIKTKRFVFIGGNLKWQELSVAPHERTLSFYGNESLTDLTLAQTRAFVPWRAWGGFTVSPEGRAYYLGGGDGDYHGTEVDTCDLSQVSGGLMPWQQNAGPPFDDPRQKFRRTHTPQAGDSSGYGSAGSNWMWFDATETAWQHDAVHMYANATTHASLGLVVYGNVPRDLSMPGNKRDHGPGIKSWSAATGRWTGQVLVPFDGNQGAFGDFNREHEYLLYANVLPDRTTFYQWSPNNGVQAAPTISTPINVSFNGACVWLGGHRFLLVRTGLNGAAKLWLYTHSLSSPALEQITPPVFASIMQETPENGYWCVDHDHQKIWWLVGTGQNGAQGTGRARLFYAALGDPANFIELPFMDVPGFRPSNNSVTTAGLRGMQYWGGFLWMTQPGSGEPSTDGRTYRTRFWRMPVF